ncbi:MAG: hypothetical protein NVSMB29_09890 [Candidatus Dormibacteria bacterium]
METASLRPVEPGPARAPELAGDLERALWALRAYDTTALATISAAGPHVAGVFFAPERDGDRLRLLLAVLRNSRKQTDLVADPRVAFMCSPGNPSRWIQGSGRATLVSDEARHHDLYMRLIEHAAGARAYVENLPVVPVILSVERLTVFEEAGRPPLILELGTPG